VPVADLRGRGRRTAADLERDASGVRVGSGVYFYDVRAGTRVERGRLVLMR